jgi:hypothetical protein
MGLTGTGVSNPNRNLRFLMIIFVGVMAFGAVMYWRHHALIAEEYVEFPEHNQAQRKSELRSKNFQIDTLDASPSVN